MRMRHFAKEPFVHFLSLGAIIFAANLWFERKPQENLQDGGDRIVIDQQDYDHLKQMWKIQWKREPTAEEIKAVIDRYVRQEVFYREALEMNLDHNDEIIKKRLAQKMEAVANDLGQLMQPPTDEQLEKFFHAHEELFQLPQSYAFRQVLFLPDERESGSEIDETLAALQAGGEIPAERRSKLSVPNEWALTPVNDLENAFGGGFSESLAELAVNVWSGPIRSGYGWHLVFIETEQAPKLPDFERVKDYVARQYEYQSELEAQDRIYQELLGQYQVAITADDVPAGVSASFDTQ